MKILILLQQHNIMKEMQDFFHNIKFKSIFVCLVQAKTLFFTWLRRIKYDSAANFL